MSYIGKNPKVDSVKLDGSATVPTGAAVEGQVYFNTGTGAISEGLKVYKNAQYVSIDKQLGDADTIELLKASDVGGLQWKVAINSTSTTVGMNSPVPQYNATATGFANASSTFANSSTGNALLTNESADIVFAYESHTVNSKNDYFGIQVDIPKAFRGQNLVLQFEYRTAEASAATSDNDFLVSIQDDTNKAQTTNSTTTGSQAAGTSVAVASSTGFAVGDFVRVESGTAASGNQANSFTEAYVTAIADSTHLTFSETIVFPASGTSGIIAANWLIDQNAGQLVEADSDSNKVGKVYKVQFKTEETTAKINISIMNQSTTAAGIDIFIDNILISANKFLQASSQTKSECYVANIQNNFWTGTGHTRTWDSTLLVAQAGSPPLAQSNLLTISNITSGTNTVTAIQAKQDITLAAGIGARSGTTGLLAWYNSSDEAILYDVNNYNHGEYVADLAITLKKDDYVYGYNQDRSGTYFAWGNAWITATPEASPVILLESQDEIFTDWQDYTPTIAGFGIVTLREARWRRVAGDMEVVISWKNGNVAGVSPTITIPSGYNMDESKLDSQTSILGTYGRAKGTNNWLSNSDGSLGVVIYQTSQGGTKLITAARDANTTDGFKVDDGSTISSTGDIISLFAKFPIQGWNTNFNPLLSMPLVEIGGNKEKGLWETHAGYSTAATKTQYYSNETYNEISNLGTVVNNSTDGWKFTASQNVKVTAIQVISSSAGGAYFGWSLNATDITSSIESLTYANGKLLVEGNQSANGLVTIPITTLMKAGDVLRPQGGGSTIDNLLGYQNMNLVVEKDYSNTNMAHIIKPAVAIIKDVKAYNVAGGTNVSGTGTWTARDLNTIEGESWFVALSGTTGFTLEPGTYEISYSCPFYRVDACASRLYDSTNSVAVADGEPLYNAASNYIQAPSLGNATVTIGSSTTYQVQYSSQTSNTTYGLGYYNYYNSSSTSVYTQVKIRKLK